MPTKFIDFREVKSRVGIRDALSHYGFFDQLKDKGKGKLVGPCPIHGGKNPNGFHINTEKNVFHCFTKCGGGNVLDLVMKVEGCDIRDAGLKLADWFGIQSTREATNHASKEATSKSEERVEATKQPAPSQATETVGDRSEAEEGVINPPLDHELKTLDYRHPYLTQRGLTEETIKTFGIGFCSRGLLRNRVAVPLHDHNGILVAYAGRAVEDDLAKEEGRYKLPAGLKKGALVYRLHRAREHAAKGLIVVEGFFDCMKIHQAGFPNVVALMGSTMTEQQEMLLVTATDRLILMLDGDEAGRKCIRQFYGRLRTKLFLKEVPLVDGEQPDALSEERIRALLGSSA